MRTELIDKKTDIRTLSKDVISSYHATIKNKRSPKKCIYLTDTECTAPGSLFEVCKTCPYGYIYCFGDIVKNVYRKTVGFTIDLLNKEISLNSIFKIND
ncbi:MAG: hypothetical protein NTZ10_05095 [Candidatus Saganbacteria bacterium]|nr:hypothetical protein [Candidatus Saganbacteria bacterium]